MMDEVKNNTSFAKRRKRKTKKTFSFGNSQSTRSKKTERNTAHKTKPATKHSTCEPRSEKRPNRIQKPIAQQIPPMEEDAGLLLISRKPPAVKYANFEEYMKNHASTI